MGKTQKKRGKRKTKFCEPRAAKTRWKKTLRGGRDADAEQKFKSPVFFPFPVLEKLDRQRVPRSLAFRRYILARTLERRVAPKKEEELRREKRRNERKRQATPPFVRRV